jgi:hypothetical protein
VTCTGTFYAFGPALSDVKGVVQFVSGEVKTTHPKAGQKSSIVVPKASTQIAGIVEQFGDLPAIAEEEVKTLDVLKKENADLKRELRTRPMQVQKQTEANLRERVEVPVLSPEQYDAIMKSLADLRAHAKDIKSVGEMIEAYPLGLEAQLDILKQAVEKYSNSHLHTFRESMKAPIHYGIDRGGNKDKSMIAKVQKTDAGINVVSLMIINQCNESSMLLYG